MDLTDPNLSEGHWVIPSPDTDPDIFRAGIVTFTRSHDGTFTREVVWDEN